MAFTIRDIAKYSGLAIGTVSKYLNGQSVREVNRVKIEEAINTLDYQVNHFARGLKTNKTMTVGVLVESLGDVFVGEIMSEIDRILNLNGYSIIVSEYTDNYELFESKLKFLYSKKVDGIITTSATYVSDKLKDIMDDIPVVFFDYYQKNLNADGVLIDNLDAIYTATTEIIRMGHRRIGIILNTQEHSMTSDERFKGYENALANYFMELSPELIRYGYYTMEGGYKAMNELLDLPNPPSVVIVSNYYMTMGAYMAIHNRKLNIPDDISFMGFDKIIIADLIQPKLSIVEQPMAEISASISELLLERMTGKRVGEPVIRRLKPKVHITDSIKTLNL